MFNIFSIFNRNKDMSLNSTRSLTKTTRFDNIKVVDAQLGTPNYFLTDSDFKIVAICTVENEFFYRIEESSLMIIGKNGIETLNSREKRVLARKIMEFGHVGNIYFLLKGVK